MTYFEGIHAIAADNYSPITTLEAKELGATGVELSR